MERSETTRGVEDNHFLRIPFRFFDQSSLIKALLNCLGLESSSSSSSSSGPENYSNQNGVSKTAEKTMNDVGVAGREITAEAKGKDPPTDSTGQPGAINGTTAH